jgi:hypothetical protein
LAVDIARSSDSKPLQQIALATGATLLAYSAYFLQRDPLIVLIAATLPLAFVAVLQRPAIWCLLFLMIAFFRLTDAYPFLAPARLLLLFGLALFASLVWHTVMTRSETPYWSVELTLFALIVAQLTLGVIFAADRPKSLDAWVGGFARIAPSIIAICWAIRRTGDFRAVTACFISGGVLISLVAIYNRVNGIGLVEGTRVAIGREIGSNLGDPNDLAFILLPSLAVALSAALEKIRPVWRWMSLASAAIILLAIGFTQSRGGLLGAVAIFAIVGARFIRSRAALLVVCSVAALAFFNAMGIAGRLSGGSAELATRGVDESSELRFIAWRAGVNMALARPLTGVGLANFSGSFYTYTSYWPGRAMAPHSVWFQVLGESGLLGFALYIAMLVTVARTAYRNLLRTTVLDAPPVMHALARALLGALAAFCAAGTFLSQAHGWPIFLLLALTVAIKQYLDDLERERTVSPVSAASADRSVTAMRGAD